MRNSEERTTGFVFAINCLDTQAKVDLCFGAGPDRAPDRLIQGFVAPRAEIRAGGNIAGRFHPRTAQSASDVRRAAGDGRIVDRGADAERRFRCRAGVACDYLIGPSRFHFLASWRSTWIGRCAPTGCGVCPGPRREGGYKGRVCSDAGADTGACFRLDAGCRGPSQDSGCAGAHAISACDSCAGSSLSRRAGRRLRGPGNQ